jgi:predicted TIM-barrel fold metal-dependent hydrolase
MLYDVHTHIGVETSFYLRGWWPYSASTRDLLTHMDAHGIDKAVCFPFTLPSAFDPYAFAERNVVELLPNRFPFDHENRLLAQEIERIDTDKRLIQFFMFDPSRKTAEQIQAAEKLLPHIHGLKTQTTVIRSPIRALLNEGRELMLFAQQHDLPVLFHTSYHPNDTWAQIKDCLEIAETYPRIRFNLAHSLRFSAPDLKRAAQLPNVWVDCSAHLNHCTLALDNSIIIPPTNERVDADYSKPADVLQAIHSMLNGKYLWGSDNPYMAWCDDKLKLMFSYKDEADVLHALPEKIRLDMAQTAPRNWLGRER